MPPTPSYFITGVDLKMMYGHKFTAKNWDKSDVTFRIPIPDPGAGWPRGGLEAYGLLVDCHHPVHGTIPSFLKVFREDLIERRDRNKFLIQLGLAKHHPWLFHGMPYLSFRGKVNGVQIVAHAARQLIKGSQSEDMSRLRDHGQWNFGLDVRRRLAGHLCCAVAALEQLDFVHSDLSPKNVVVTTAPDGSPAAVLCDYDGFIHPGQAMLPMEFRPKGTQGYQSPEVVERLDRKDPDIWVDSDRFALGVLACEIMVWQPNTADELNRGELLTSDFVRKRDASGVPAALQKRWPDGFKLLQRAMKAPSKQALPSPAEWLHALGVRLPADLVPAIPLTGIPRIAIRRRFGHPPRITEVREVRLRSDRGSFRNVDPNHRELAAVEFVRRQGTLALKFAWKSPVILTRAGQATITVDGPCTIQVQAGDRLNSAFFEFDIYQDPGP
jgi:Protein kinase domain.